MTEQSATCPKDLANAGASWLNPVNEVMWLNTTVHASQALSPSSPPNRRIVSVPGQRDGF
ncbi:hypothetical protein [Aquabacterium sp.]|uniref:hypothetical protein n=1 Tax=Aquabacterium sp. TaxID=1872578 RepID=UPI0025C39145|nr:hypothetical protein [Aquabacterium sp.]